MAFIYRDGYVTAKVHKDASTPAAGPAPMTRARIEKPSLTAAAALVWNGDLPRPLQQVLFDTADSITG
jgi:hypothetical protein